MASAKQRAALETKPHHRDVGLDINDKQFVIPLEAKGANDRLSKTQIVQIVDFARSRYPRLILCRWEFKK